MKQFAPIMTCILAFWLVSCAAIKEHAAMRASMKELSICELHGCKMDYVVVTVDDFAGRVMPDEFYSARGSIFPHSGTVFPVCSFYPNREKAWRCPECARLGKIWCAQNLSSQPLL